MDRPPSPLFRQAAIEAASGTQIGASLTTHWRGVAAFTAVAFVLLAALIAFVAIVEYSPVHRVAAFVDARGGLVRLKAPLDGRVARLAVTDGAVVRKGDLLAVIGSERLREEGDGERSAVRQSLEAEKATLEREIEAARQEAAVNGSCSNAASRGCARSAKPCARRSARASACSPVSRRKAITSPRLRPKATCRASRRRRSATRSRRRRAGSRARAARPRASSARSRRPRPSVGSSTHAWPA